MWSGDSSDSPFGQVTDLDTYYVDVRVSDNGDKLQCRFSSEDDRGIDGVSSYKYQPVRAGDDSDQPKWLDLEKQDDGSWKTGEAYCNGRWLQHKGYYQINLS
jgi:hypothetical protein